MWNKKGIAAGLLKLGFVQLAAEKRAQGSEGKIDPWVSLVGKVFLGLVCFVVASRLESELKQGRRC